MPFKELSPLARELYLKTQIAQLRSLYRSQQTKLSALVNSGELTEFSRTRAEEILKQVDQIVMTLNRGAAKWADSSLPESYVRGVDLAAERLKALNVTRFVSRNALIHTQAVSVLINDVTVDMISSNEGIRKFFNRFIRQSQQRIIEDQAISKIVAEGLVSGSTRRTVSDTVLRELRQKMRNEQFLSINGRNYRPDSYAEMLARTRTREATSQGSINTALRYGVDLVQIDAHAEVCEFCQQFSGRVYSISGGDPDFPTLKEKPPFHPNCICVLVPVTRTTLERRGYLDEVIKLSNDPSVEVSSFSRFEKVLETI